MIKFTQSFSEWLFKYHKDIYGLILFGHLELLTEEMQKDYLEWCKTDEGKQYLKGGSKYEEDAEYPDMFSEERGGKDEIF